MISLFLCNCQVAEKATEMASKHMHHLRFFGTNWWDAHITLIICVSIVIAILVIALAILRWQKKKIAETMQQAIMEKKDEEVARKDTVFKDICSFSRDKDGKVDIAVANSLFDLYKKIEDAKQTKNNQNASDKSPQ